MGIFIAIDGLDASGKQTQTEKLCKHLESQGKEYRHLSFPTYDEKYSALVKLYLDGAFGDKPTDVNAYAASTFFAADRYASYMADWKKDYDEGKIILSDRYTTANAVHQLSKMPENEWDAFLDWLWDYEYKKLGVPSPDLVLYLEMTPEISMKLVSHRSNETGQVKDIHELDPEHLKNSYKAAIYSSDKLGWERICCYRDGEPLSIDEISEMVAEKVHNSLRLCAK